VRDRISACRGTLRRALVDRASVVCRRTSGVRSRGASGALLLRQHRPLAAAPKFRIATWDAGWWQARCALADASLGAAELSALKQAHDALKAKLLPQLGPLGFLP
jgi:hypothetical protein